MFKLLNLVELIESLPSELDAPEQYSRPFWYAQGAFIFLQDFDSLGLKSSIQLIIAD